MAFGTVPEATFIINIKEKPMDISTATTLASGLVALIVPAFVQAFKKYIPSGYVGLVSPSCSAPSPSPPQVDSTAPTRGASCSRE